MIANIESAATKSHASPAKILQSDENASMAVKAPVIPNKLKIKRDVA